MWESKMGKSIIAVASDASAAALPSLRALAGPSRGAADRKLLQAAADLFQHRGFRRLDPLEIGEGFSKARARNDDHAVAIADHHIARGDRDAAAYDRQADRSGPTSAWRIWSEAHRVDRQV